MHESGEQVAVARSERGEVVLLRRGEAWELRVNGVFVMDTRHTDSERLLASTTLRETGGGRVLVGGLGLGFTLDEVLTDPRVTTVHVVEIEPAVVDWNRRGLIVGTAHALRDSRVRVSTGDVAEVLTGLAPGSVDVVLLDVDNGPGYLVYDRNEAVYRDEFLTTCREVLAPRGHVAIWSASPSADLAEAMRQVFGEYREIAVPVVLGTTNTSYHLYLSRRP